MPSPLSQGCKFYIYPKYRFECHDRVVHLTRAQGDILSVLMSQPGRSFSPTDLAEVLYQHRKKGGPSAFKPTIWVQVFRMIVRFRDAGIDLNLKSPMTRLSYVFGTVKPIDGWVKSEQVKPPRKRTTPERQIRQKAQQYEDFRRNVSDWTFPEQRERISARR